MILEQNSTAEKDITNLAMKNNPPLILTGSCKSGSPAMNKREMTSQTIGLRNGSNLAGSIEGVIEEVGFRSTRIRTLEKTLISVPNAKIAHCTVNNYAKIPERRFTCTLGLRYDTTTAQMEAFIDDLRGYLTEHDMIKSDSVLVYFSNMNSFSLDIMIMAFINSNAWIDLVQFKHDAFLQFMRIAEHNGVGFAFPTTTIELEDQHTPQ